MSVRVSDEAVYVEGLGDVADAEPLLSALLDDPARPVDLGNASRLHSAVIQVLLALRPRITAAPRDPFYSLHIARLLDAGQGRA